MKISSKFHNAPLLKPLLLYCNLESVESYSGAHSWCRDLLCLYAYFPIQHFLQTLLQFYILLLLLLSSHTHKDIDLNFGKERVAKLPSHCLYQAMSNGEQMIFLKCIATQLRFLLSFKRFAKPFFCLLATSIYILAIAQQAYLVIIPLWCAFRGYPINKPDTISYTHN